MPAPGSATHRPSVWSTLPSRIISRILSLQLQKHGIVSGHRKVIQHDRSDNFSHAANWKSISLASLCQMLVFEGLPVKKCA